MQIQQTKLAIADCNEMRNVFAKVGILTKKLDKSEDEVLFKSKEDMEDGTVATCEGCGTEMKMSNFGHLAKGSKWIYCKNPLCFNHYVANKKLR